MSKLVYDRDVMEFCQFWRFFKDFRFFKTFRDWSPTGLVDDLPCFHARECPDGNEDRKVWFPDLLHQSLTVMKAIPDDGFLFQLGVDEIESKVLAGTWVPGKFLERLVATREIGR